MQKRTKQNIYLSVFQIIVVDFPNLFNPSAPKPLSSLIKAQLYYHYDKKLSPECIQLFLGKWTGRIEYHRAILEQEYRFDLFEEQTRIDYRHKAYALKNVQQSMRPSR